MHRAYLWSAKVFLTIEIHNEHVGWLHEFFLYAAGGNVDFVFMSDAGSSTRACDLTIRRNVSDHSYVSRRFCHSRS